MSISKDSTMVGKATELFWRFPDEIPAFIWALQLHSSMVLLLYEQFKEHSLPGQIGRLNFFVLSAQRTLEMIEQHGDCMKEDIAIFAFSLFDWMYVDFVVNFLKSYGDGQTENEDLATFINEYFN